MSNLPIKDYRRAAALHEDKQLVITLHELMKIATRSKNDNLIESCKKATAALSEKIKNHDYRAESECEDRSKQFRELDSVNLQQKTRENAYDAYWRKVFVNFDRVIDTGTL